MSSIVHIAIIEDDLMIAQMYRMKFEAEGFDVNVAADGKDGLAMVESHRPDIILLDIQLPEMDGATVLRKIRALPGGQEIPVITGRRKLHCQSQLYPSPSRRGNQERAGFSCVLDASARRTNHVVK